jgi:hypothetical protein
MQLIFQQEMCLVDTSGIFDGCAPYDLVCLCNLDEDELSRYVTTVHPCIDGPLGSEMCTDGAIYRKFPGTFNNDRELY